MGENEFQVLITQLKKGNEAGLAQVYRETSQYCIRTLIKKTSIPTEDAEDLLMDAILIFRENVLSGKLSTLTSLKSYLFGICWNLWRERNRAQEKWATAHSEIERQLFWIQTMEHSTVKEEAESTQEARVRMVTKALADMSERCRKLLTYVYVEGRSQQEIAELMEFASANVVKVTRHRCYKQWMSNIEQTQARNDGQ
ncbi:MAG: RNA polymerase sigma factor [Bacteroidia bacterium]|nr:RNA polymerase sigma factor [Bacteroidia bacterium]MDP5170121.1 RNA polymerase sigma factor [Bacteroidia bacterium]